MKRMTAKEILAESFRELAQGTSIDRITVKDITSNCGYSQATFYRQFKDKYDLVAWSYTRDLEKILDQLTGDEQSWKQTLFSTASYYEQHKRYLANLLNHTSGYDSFVVNMTEIHQKILLKTLERLHGAGSVDETARVYGQIYCYGTVLFSCDWILGKYQMSTEELADIYDKALPAPLGSYITAQ